MNDPIYKLHQGTLPLLVSVPHAGTQIPPDLRHAFTDKASQVEDTDWHLEKLYSFVPHIGASMIAPVYSRYVIDLNRPSDNEPMYPGANNTELCPTRAFTGEYIYRDAPPSGAEISRRVQRYWQPYHKALAADLSRIKAIHGYALLWDGHSIKSELPWLFEGRLPDLNIGTVNGTSCASSLEAMLAGVLQSVPQCKTFTHVFNGRFKGGYITRTYGDPANHIHAVQLEQCWSTYMDETAPYQLNHAKRPAIEITLRALLQAMLDWKPAL
jgi:N-formylglutamate deformylase